MNIGLISDLISSRIMATGLSGESQVRTILVAVFSPIMGFITDKFGLSNALVFFGLLLFILSPILFVRERKRTVT